jgi:hypothetical protein
MGGRSRRRCITRSQCVTPSQFLSRRTPFPLDAEISVPARVLDTLGDLLISRPKAVEHDDFQREQRDPAISREAN